MINGAFQIPTKNGLDSGYAQDPECKVFSYLDRIDYDGFCFYK